MGRLIANPDIDVAPVFPPDTLMGGARLAQPRKEVPRLAPTPLRQVIISDRTRAIGNLVRRAQERRSITPMKLRAYAEKSAAGNGRCRQRRPALRGQVRTCEPSRF